MDLLCIALAGFVCILGYWANNLRNAIVKANETIKSLGAENKKLVHELYLARELANRTVDMPEPKHDLSRRPLGGYNSTDEFET